MQSQTLFYLWDWHSGRMELVPWRHSPPSPGSRMGLRGIGGRLAAPFYLVPYSREGELPGQELAPLLPEM